jgi:hypothetical protein
LLSIDIHSGVCKKRSHNLKVTLYGCAHERGKGIIIPSIDIYWRVSRVREKHLHHCKVSIFACDVERTSTGGVWRIEVHVRQILAILKEKLDDSGTSALDSESKRFCAVRHGGAV